MRGLLFLALLLCCLPALATPAMRLVIDGPVGPATSHYIVDGLAAAEAGSAPLVILQLDTPGGLGTAMREIVQAILASPVPVVGYVAPSGARAASAGTYILYATHIAAMAPATTLGAATPVRIAGGTPLASGSGRQSQDQTGSQVVNSATAMRHKVINDAVAYIRGLANQRGRNADWAERAVRDAATLTAEAALNKNVIDQIAPNTSALLASIDGRRVTTSTGPVTLHTGNLRVRTQEPDWRTQFLSVITNPTIAYILLLVGICGLLLEGLNPGAILPGVVGGVCLLTALFAFQLLPVSFVGLGLIGLGLALMIGEAFAPSFGILGVGGVVSFVFGSILLMDTDVPGYQVSIAVIAAIAVVGASLTFLIIYLLMYSRRSRVVSGREGMVGATAEALESFDQNGRVFVHGETWRAITRQPLQRGQSARVVAVNGLTVTVEPER